MTEPTPPPAAADYRDERPKPWAALALVGLGGLLRVLFYARCRPLWLDEAMLAIGITGKSLAQVLGPLEYKQIAPMGWLSIEWLCVQCLGANEYALRLAPLLFGLASIPLAYRVASKLLDGRGTLVALALFCICEPLVYYSAELKPYSADVFASLLLVSLSLRVLSGGFAVKDVLMLGVAGGAMTLLSMTAVFVMGGVMGILFLWTWRTQRHRALPIMVVSAAYVMAFLAYYLLWLAPLASSEISANMASTQRMAPMPPRSIADVRWYLDTLVNFFVDPMGFKAMGLAMIATAIGAIGVARRSRWLLALLLAPLLLGLLASMLQKYPFTTFEQYEHPLRGRYIIYTVPPVLLLTAGGLAWLWHALAAYRRGLGVLLLAVILWHPLYRIAQNIKQPPDIGDIRACMAYLKSHAKESDVVYHSWVAEPPFRFYRSQYGLDDVPSFGGARPIVRKAIDPDAWTRIDDWKQSESLFEAHRGRRVWLLFIHHPSSFGYEDEKNLLNHLDDRGKRLDRFRANGASLTLYEMSP